MFRKLFGLSLLMMSLSTLFWSCAEGDKKTKTAESTSPTEADLSALDVDDSKRALLVESIIRSSPTIAESGKIFADIGSDFDRSVLNDIENVSNYITIRDQGVNLGVYLADLGYITAFEQSQEIIFYMNCAQKMAEGIGVSDIFNEETVERMEMNINDKDSIIALISEMYWKTDAFLKELGRENISALIICGGWVEGMHIGAQLLENNADNEILYQKMLFQRKNLIKIITLFDTFQGDDSITPYALKLKEIEEMFKDLDLKESDQTTPEQREKLKLIAQKVEVLRSEMAQT